MFERRIVRGRWRELWPLSMRNNVSLVLHEIEMIAIEWDSFGARRQCGYWKRWVWVQSTGSFFMLEHLIGRNFCLDILTPRQHSNSFMCSHTVVVFIHNKRNLHLRLPIFDFIAFIQNAESLQLWPQLRMCIGGVHKHVTCLADAQYI